MKKNNTHYGIIYLATNKKNGACYVGQTKSDLNIRRNSHIKCPQGKFGNALSEFGVKAFTWEILDYAMTSKSLTAKENKYIKKYNVEDNGYNIVNPLNRKNWTRFTLVLTPKLYQQIRIFAFKKEKKMATAIRDLLVIALKKSQDPTNR